MDKYGTNYLIVSIKLYVFDNTLHKLQEEFLSLLLLMDCEYLYTFK